MVISADELENLLLTLAETQEMLRAMRAGEVDSIVADRSEKSAADTLKGATAPYQILVEKMSEGALMVSSTGVILYCNAAFATMVAHPRERLIGEEFLRFIAGPDENIDLTDFLSRTARNGQEVRVRAAGAENRRASVRSTEATVDHERVHCLVITDLSRSETYIRHEAMVGSSPDAIFALQRDGKITDWNAAASRLFHYTAQEAIGQDFHLIFSPERLDEGERVLRRALRGDTVHFDTCCVTKVGDQVEVSFGVSPVSSLDGDIGVIIVTARDITERRQVEEARRASEERWKLGAAVAGLALARIDYSRDCNHLSAEAARLFGFGDGPVTLPREAIHAMFHPLDRTELLRRVEAALDPIGPGWFDMDHRILLPNQETRWLRVRKQVFFDDASGCRAPSHAILAAFDITLEKTATESLRQSEEFVRVVLDLLPQEVVVLDADGTVIAVNEAWRSFGLENGGGGLTGLSVGANYLDVCRSSATAGDTDARVTLEGLEALIAEHSDTFMAEYPCDGLEGKRWFVMHAARLKSGPGAVILSHTEITDQKKAEEAMRESEQRFRALAEMSPDAILVAVDDRYVYANLAAVKLLGANGAEEIIGRTPYDVVDPAFHEIFRERIRLAREEKLTMPLMEYRWRRLLDKAPINVEVATGPIAWDGKPAVQAVARDITERSRAEVALRQSEERFRAIFDFAATGIAIIEWDGRIAHCNPAYCRLLGYSEHELKGIPSLDLVHPDDRAANQSEVQRIKNQLTTRFEIENRYLRKDGQSVWVRKFLSCLCDDTGEPAYLLILVNDITEQRKMAQALRDADRRKDEFLAMLAHELRNPLAPIRNAVYVLQKSDNIVSEASERSRSLLAMVERQIDHLVHLVDDLLEVSRITSGKIQLKKENSDLAAILRHAVETSEPHVHARGHKLTVELPSSPVTLDADPVRLAQVFANLLNNSAKYTDPGGRICLRAELKGDEVIVHVQDNGMGISAEMLPNVFDLFSQSGGAVGRAEGGLGIGLALARSLVQLHGGHLGVSSDGPGQGSEFLVCLPLQPGLSGATRADGDNIALDPRWRILVIDDDRSVADSFAMLLGCLGASARVAYRGDAALGVVAEFRPQLVFVDIGMPGLDGYETARQIRQMPEGKCLVLVALTGWGQERDRLRAIEAGFDHHFVKPISVDALEKILASRPPIE